DPVEPLAEVPFSSRWKWSALSIPAEPGSLLLGAAETLLPGGAPPHVAEHEAEGRRALLLARSDDPVHAPDGAPGAPPGAPPAAQALATVVLEERVRPDATETLAYLRDQNVAVKVLSGDSPATVSAVAARAGLPPGGVWEGGELPRDQPELQAM